MNWNYFSKNNLKHYNISLNNKLIIFFFLWKKYLNNPFQCESLFYSVQIINHKQFWKDANILCVIEELFSANIVLERTLIWTMHNTLWIFNNFCHNFVKFLKMQLLRIKILVKIFWSKRIILICLNRYIMMLSNIIKYLEILGI